MKTIVIVESVFHKGKAVFEQVDDLRIVVASENEDDLAQVVAENEAFGVVIGVERYTQALYNRLPSGGIIARYGVGYDGVDLKKAERRGILVTNTPGVLAQTVAESTVLLAGECFRNMGRLAVSLKAGKWESTTGVEFQGKTWAIVGLGAIGKRVAKIMSLGFGAQVVALKRDSIDTEEAMRVYGVSGWFDDFESLVANADVVSIHLPANEETRQYINREKLAQMGQKTILINTSRGALVDEDALYDALVAGKLGGAGLDVFEHEPYQPVPDKDLRTLDQVVMTPHIGSNTDACNQRMALGVLRNISAAASAKIEELDLVTR